MKKIIPILTLLFMLVLTPINTFAAGKRVDVTATSGRNTITVKISSNINSANRAKVVVTGGGLWKLHRGGKLHSGNGTIKLDDLYPNTEYKLEVTLYREGGNLCSSSDNTYYNDYTKILTVKTSAGNSYKTFKNISALAKEIMKTRFVDKETTYLLQTRNKVSENDLRKTIRKRKDCRALYYLIGTDPFSITKVSSYKSGGVYNTIFNVSPFVSNKDTTAAKNKKCFEKADRIVKRLQPQLRGKGKKGKAYVLYNYIAKHCSYSKNSKYNSAYDVLTRGKSRCEGYAKAFVLLCDRAGIKAILVSGSNHCYAACEIGGKLYVCDPTWDDNGSKASKKYFMKGTKSSFFKHSGHELSKARRTIKLSVWTTHKIAR